MLNAYPDSLGGTLGDIVSFLSGEEVKGAFGAFYILPSLFHSDLDRGFCIVDYGLNEELASKEDIEALQKLGIDLKLDFVLNHLSLQSKQFLSLIQEGEKSPYRDFFIDWNKFWEGHGSMTEEGYIEPDPECIKDMFFRKPGLPILMVEFPDGSRVPYWNTFYQQIDVDENGKKHYLGQMDLNIRSDKVWEFYDEVLKQLAGYGARIVRLDAFAYAPKEVGAKNFLNEPGTWDLLERIHSMAEPLGLSLLPEIHESYEKKTYEKIGEKGYMVYDFFLPGLMIDALERRDASRLAAWAQETLDKGFTTVNMLGCHDGIPLLDLKGMMPDDEIQELIDITVGRGGYVKDLHSSKKMYYQVNATYYSAIGEDDDKMLMARAIQLFMPGKPQIWYLDLFAGKNDHEAVAKAGPGGHKEINRTNLTAAMIEEGLKKPVVQKQLELLKFRRSHKAFRSGADIEIKVPEKGLLEISWKTDEAYACLHADLNTMTWKIESR